ncbi:MAG TPA: histidine phosphatase family protein [Acidimicrobiales bacterium]|nr:histidine phosphatase family protein [Acidimicrobiales bacterium]
MTLSGPADLRHVWVLRHAKAAADSPDGDDHSRPLTKRGRRQSEEVQQFLSEARSRGAPVPTLVVSSSAARAIETAELVMPALGADVTLDTERYMYSASEEEVIDRLRRVEDEVRSMMVVGHNPAFAELVLVLVADADAPSRMRLQPYPTCALAHISVSARSWTDLVAGSGRLEELFVPQA